jgi:nitrilase
MPKSIIAALKIGSSPSGKSATLAQILLYEQRAVGSGASLIVMPEALLSGYPKGP